MKKRIFEIIEVGKDNDKLSKIYDTFMLVCIFLSIVPLFFKETTKLFTILDIITCSIFIIDYILRWYTSNCKIKKGKISYLIYPFTPFAIVDLLSILPTITIINNSFKLLRILRVFKTFRLFKTLRYSKNFQMIINIIKNKKDILISIVIFSISYILLSALIMFNVETENFDSFFDALYWATTALTTVGYGDIYPHTQIGKIVSMISSLLGIAIIALPSGVITSGFMEELDKSK